MKTKNIVSVISFYKSICSEEHKYKLINNLFIVKYIAKNRIEYVGDFLKSNSVKNPTKLNKVLLMDTSNNLIKPNIKISFCQKDIKYIL